MYIALKTITSLTDVNSGNYQPELRLHIVFLAFFMFRCHFKFDFILGLHFFTKASLLIFQFPFYNQGQNIDFNSAFGLKNSMLANKRRKNRKTAVESSESVLRLSSSGFLQIYCQGRFSCHNSFVEHVRDVG